MSIRRLTDCLLAVIFVVAISVPLVGQLSGISKPSTELTENRRAAPLPKLAVRWHGPLCVPRKGSLVDFPSKFEAYYNDHLGFRRQLVQGYNLAKLKGLTSASLGGPGVGQRAGCPVIVGREGWLYFSGERSVESYRGTAPFTEREMAEWARVLGERRAWLRQRGIEYLVVIAPDKPTIYPEFLPRAMNRVSETSRLDQLLAYLKRHDGVELVDLRSELTAAKATYPTYYRTDTHWNCYGAFLGYQKIGERLAERFRCATPKSLGDFTVDVHEGPGLDIVTMLDAPCDLQDTYVDLQPRQPFEATITQVAAEAGARECRVSENPAAPPGRCVVIHDSFFLNAIPYFAEHWRHAAYVWTFDFPAEMIERERPQVVVQEIVERKLFLRPQNPSQLSTPLPPAQLAREPHDDPSTR